MTMIHSLLRRHEIHTQEDHVSLSTCYIPKTMEHILMILVKGLTRSCQVSFILICIGIIQHMPII
jgi:hypothetical protein